MNRSQKKQIIAIGGGGFSNPDSNFLIEEYFIHQTHKKQPRICFVPTASGEEMKYILAFYRVFGELECKPTHLSFFNLPTNDLESFVMDHDAIYVGGGNTKSMLALWREWGFDICLKKAWEGGILLGGISAGALCWFEEGVTDSIPGKLTAIKGLGLLSGSFCPHYDSEKNRRPSYHQLIKKGMKSGIAVEDHVAVHYVGKKLYKVVRANSSREAHFVSERSGRIWEKKIKSVTLQEKK